MSKSRLDYSKPFTRKEWINVIWGFIGISLLISFVIWGNRTQKNENELLDKYGKETTAVTIESRCTKRGTHVKYYYFVNNMRFESWAKIPVENLERIDVKIPEGKYKLTYYPKKPKIHRINLRQPIRNIRYKR
jgi:hypothetical protein